MASASPVQDFARGLGQVFDQIAQVQPGPDGEAYDYAMLDGTVLPQMALDDAEIETLENEYEVTLLVPMPDGSKTMIRVSRVSPPTS